MKRFVALGACVGLAASSFALMPSALAAPKQPGIVGAGGSAKPAADGELTASFTLAQTAAQKSLTRDLAGKRSHGTSASFASTQPAVSHRDAVLSWAARNAFRVVHSSRFLVTVAGPSTELAAALGTSLKSAKGYTVPVAAPAVPADLASHAESVVGLDNRPRYRHHLEYGPADVRAMSNNVVQSSAAGAGVTVGIANFSGWSSSDLTSFASAPMGPYGNAPALSLAPGQITEVSVDGTNPALPDGLGGDGEVALDAEAVLAAAPAAKQRLYFGDNTEAGSLAIWDKMATDAQAGLLQVVSTSWGGCESTYNSFPAALNAEVNRIDTLIAAGVTVFAASGDSGAYDCSYEGAVNNTTDVDFPASEPRVVGVGGTSTQASGPLSYSHQGWGPATVNTSPNASTFQGYGSGGGYSSHFISGPAGQPTSTRQGRQVPDIAALSDPATGFVIYNNGYGVAGGTSLAAPLSAAGLAGVLAKRTPVAGVGNILPTLYANTSVTHDVVGNGNGYYPASAGYDHVTGLGVMDWTAFAALVYIPDPSLSVPSAVSTQVVPLTITADDSSFTSWGVAQGTSASCASNDLTSKPTSVLISATQGTHTITLTALDTKGVCHAVTRPVFFDNRSPAFSDLLATYTGTTTPRFKVSWTLADVAPSSGLGMAHLQLYDVTLGKTVYVKDTTAGSMSLNAVPGHYYNVILSASDNATNKGERGTSFLAPTDDRAFAFSGFQRQYNSQDFMGSHATASRAGSYSKVTFNGKLAWVGIIKSRSCGYMDVYVDGVRKARVNLYSASTLFRQQLRVATFSTAGTHTVVVKAVGVHQSGSTGNNIYVDSLTVA